MVQNDSLKSSKKLKQKKVPQRGLGVAQLEKIRLEERQSKNCVLQSSFQLQSELQLQSVLQNDKPLLASEFIQNPQLGAHPAFKSYIGSQLSNKQLNVGQSSGFAFSRPKSNESYDSIPSFAAVGGIPTKELVHHHKSSSSMVKVSSGSSSSSSVITHNQTEPPSNQSFLSKIFASTCKVPVEEKFIDQNCVHLVKEFKSIEEIGDAVDILRISTSSFGLCINEQSIEFSRMMIGSKRAYPFSLENLLNPAYPNKFPHLPVHAEPRKPLLREELASSSVRPEIKTEKVTGKSVKLDGDFLTLALPKPTLPHPTQELKEVGSSLQENDGEPSFYNFLPTSEGINGQASNTDNSGCSGEVAEKLDLNLKL